MKSSILIFFSLLLASAILAPSIITLADFEGKTEIVMDFNEEEKKEEKKETSEKDFLLFSNLNVVSSQQKEKITIPEFYFESGYATCVAIFLPPPQFSI